MTPGLIEELRNAEDGYPYDEKALLVELNNLNLSDGSMYEARENYIRENLETGSEILCLGCGTGVLMERLEPDYEFTGIDPSKYSLEKASERLEDPKLIQGSATDIPLTKEFDAATVLGRTLNHIHCDDLTDLFQEIRSSLSEGGSIMLDSYYAHTFLALRLNRSEIELEDGTSIWYENRVPAEVLEETEGMWRLVRKYEVETENETIERELEKILHGYTPEHVEERLRETGFEIVENQDVSEFENHGDEGISGFFISAQL